MKPIAIHCCDNLDRGGTQVGLCNLAREGFYNGIEAHFLALVRGEGGIAGEMAALVGAARVHCLRERKDLVDNGHLAQQIIVDLIELLAQAIERLRPATLILSLPITNFVGRMAAMRFPGLRIISFEHSAVSGRHKNILAPLAHRCAAVFGDTPETLRAMHPVYPVQCPAYHVPMAVLSPGAPRTPSLPDHFELLSFGRLVALKNYAALLQALAILKAEGLRFRLAIYGEGEERSGLEALVQKLGLGAQVALPGFEGNTARLAALRERAQIYVQPSLYEGFCLAVAEALAAGMIVAATDVGGIRDYGDDRRNMMVIKGFAPDQIAATLRLIMTSYAEIAGPMSAAAVATAQDQFSRDAVHRLWESPRALLIGRDIN